eukprot:14023693-Alexandrium_andersonii.AAC.1
MGNGTAVRLPAHRAVLGRLNPKGTPDPLGTVATGLLGRRALVAPPDACGGLGRCGDGQARPSGRADDAAARVRQPVG